MPGFLMSQEDTMVEEVDNTQDTSAEDTEAQDLLADAVQSQDAPKPHAPEGRDDPDSLRAEIARLRKENASARVNAKKTAADEARNELAQQIGKALGLVEDETVDPAQLTEQLTAQTSAAKRAQLKLAVYQAATAVGGDPSALLDSQSFLSQVEQVDPSDSGAVSAAIADAIAANPRLAAQSQSRLPAPSQAHGASASGPVEPAQWSQADVERAYAARDYDGIEKARSEGRLKSVMGG